MRKRPEALSVLAGCLAVVAIGMPVQVMLIHGHYPWEFHFALAKLAPFNWVVIALCSVSIVLIWRASPWSWLSSALLVGAVLWNNWLIWKVVLNFSAVSLSASALGLIGLHGLLLSPEARKVLLNPRLRWWLTPKRYRAQVRAVIEPVLGGELVSDTFDISEGGAFITTESASWVIPLNRGVRQQQRQQRRRLGVGANCSIRLNLEGSRVIKCSAQVVRECPAQGSYPAGFAVRFVGLGRKEKSALLSYLRCVQEIAKMAPSQSSTPPSAMAA